MPGVGTGVGVGLSSEFAPPRNEAGGEVLFAPDKNPLLEKASIWVPEFEKELYEYLRRNPAAMYELSPRKFEELVASIFRNEGFDVELTPQSRDGGFDVIAVQKDQLTGESTYLVECKRYKPENKVGVGIVRSLLGVVVDQKANRGIAATTSYFTRGALEFEARNCNMLSLRDYDAVTRWLHGLGLW